MRRVHGRSGGPWNANRERRSPGRDLITAIAIGSEISCRVGSVSPGQFHRLGFHPSGLFAPFGVTYLAGKLLRLDVDAMARAAGICGSFAAGILECWVDGTQPKFLHPGWAAQSGIAAAFLARAGTTGPAAVFEGRFGLFASHLQDKDVDRDFARITGQLGTRWDSRNASFKPFPAAHVLHPYVDALLRLRSRHGIAPGDVARIDCPVAAFIVPIVCEPIAEKTAPAPQFARAREPCNALAEAFVQGGTPGRTRIGRRACGVRRFLRSPGASHYEIEIPRSLVRAASRGRPRHAEGRPDAGRSGGVQPRLVTESDDRRGASRQVRRERCRVPVVEARDRLVEAIGHLERLRTRKRHFSVGRARHEVKRMCQVAENRHREGEGPAAALFPSM